MREETQDGSIIVEGIGFRRVFWGGNLWFSACSEVGIDVSGKQPVIDVKFHQITCEKEKCRRAKAP